MYSAILTMLLVGFIATGSAPPVELLNSKFEGLYENKTPEKENVSWTQKIVPLSVRASEIPFNAEPKAVYAIDIGNGDILASKNENTELPIASLTKLVTAYVILKNHSLDEVFVVPAISTRPDDSLMGILPGEKLTIRDLLKGLLINSGSDAAQTLAIKDAGSIESFSKKMNSEIQELGLKNSRFDNPVGWDSQNNYASAQDIATLSRILLNNGFFKETVAKKTDTVYTLDRRVINLSNTNLLLNNQDIVGVKTGFTFVAGECLVNLKKDSDHQIMTVVIGSQDRFGQTRRFLDWIYKQYSW